MCCRCHVGVGVLGGCSVKRRRTCTDAPEIIWPREGPRTSGVSRMTLAGTAAWPILVSPWPS
eukprot:7329217-Pyramimonas_sp.AAC.1